MSRLKPGFYQSKPDRLDNLRGLKTGRVSPRSPVREPASTRILREHDLLPQHHAQVGSNNDFDHMQGQLFHPDAVQQRNDSNSPSVGTFTVGKNATPHGLAARPGFLPNLKTSQKRAALENTAVARIKNDVSTAGDDHIAAMMGARQKASSGPDAPWYMGVGASGRHDRSVPGDAAKLIQESAESVGVSYARQSRVVSTMSPRLAWDETKDGKKSYPNVEDAESVTRAVNSAVLRGEDHVDAGSRAANRALPRMAEKAARGLVGPADAPLHVVDPKSQKVPNFDASLHLSSPSRAIQRSASEAWAVDAHDQAIVGVGEGAYDLRGVYDVVAMTGRRQALKSGRLAPNEQAAEWEHQRSSTWRAKDAQDEGQLFRGGFSGETPQVNTDVLHDGVVRDSRSHRRSQYEMDKELFGG